MGTISRYLPFTTAITIAQASTYLFSVCFADELVALLACPFWGILSDRLGVRIVCVLGYSIVGASLLLTVQARNVYPQLLLARMMFSIGGAATATMVTAILPSMTGNGDQGITNSCGDPSSTVPGPTQHRVAPSLDSEVTITPATYNSRANPTSGRHSRIHADTTRSSPPRLAGLVGVFTGCGALVALTLFLPLPTQFSRIDGVTQGQAVADSFYVVAAIALIVACSCYFGLRGLQGEEGKGWRLLLGMSTSQLYHTASQLDTAADDQAGVSFLPYWRLLLDSTLIGFRDAQIGLGYLGGFVARASSVGISLFIPLYINAFFISRGFCQGLPNDPSPELKKECRAAYVLAAELTGVSQLVALLCAPLFGYLSDRYRRFNVPLLVASIFGIIGYLAFALLSSPEPKDIDGRGGSPAVFLVVALIGISQIGAIVCSLGLLGRGVLGDDGGYNLSSQLSRTPASIRPDGASEESSPLLATPSVSRELSRNHLKGSIAGVYSLSGGAAILLLTKLGGFLFDNLSTGAPFYMMAIFNSILFVIGFGAGIYHEVRTQNRKSS
ncbi:hypothetical protein OIDMADRAFT_100914 [Oidiodendron maius Zn]|uniref:Major facilitator superfamily (MFS) profile domain-containing protein n=1 Tax=Oidiodendron maius (strain Zn) TaxID=913774 RepID=A0A0C3HV64_OIDMZ|nr:hypothetical protein OIDMADRAFT_100914 [Oidiodendron maius Zn]